MNCLRIDTLTEYVFKWPITMSVAVKIIWWHLFFSRVFYIFTCTYLYELNHWRVMTTIELSDHRTFARYLWVLKNLYYFPVYHSYGLNISVFRQMPSFLKWSSSMLGAYQNFEIASIFNLPLYCHWTTKMLKIWPSQLTKQWLNKSKICEKSLNFFLKIIGEDFFCLGD